MNLMAIAGFFKTKDADKTRQQICFRAEALQDSVKLPRAMPRYSMK